mmetsp:Transcript_2436/g.4649  ORF Transcript_2436/g.4649 Transcript_2436/m.4649 type:complete len:136 (+) Transcript_2436:1068-1475(+)
MKLNEENRQSSVHCQKAAPVTALLGQVRETRREWSHKEKQPCSKKPKPTLNSMRNYADWQNTGGASTSHIHRDSTTLCQINDELRCSASGTGASTNRFIRLLASVHAWGPLTLGSGTHLWVLPLCLSGTKYTLGV